MSFSKLTTHAKLSALRQATTHFVVPKSCQASSLRVTSWSARPFCRSRAIRASAVTEEIQRAATAASNAALQPFHLAFPVNSISAAKEFYGSKMGCQEGRSAATWVDYSLFGHQIVCHEVKGYNATSIHNAVDGDPVPVSHFGMALTTEQFQGLADQVKSSGIEFVLEPHLRFEGQPGEQWTMFFKDPSGNALEFKAMTNPENLFAKYFVK